MTVGEVRVSACRGAAPGRGAGSAAVSSDAICFYLVDPASGVVIEGGHALEGRCVAGAVLVFPGGKGSSVVQADGLYQLAQAGTAPAALIVKEFDTVLVASAVIIGVPLVRCSPEDFLRIRDGDRVEVDSDQETITVHETLAAP
jgi:predicted aconitase with swiveling domain